MITVTTNLTAAQVERVCKGAERFAGVSLNTFVINKSQYQITVVPLGKSSYSLFKIEAKTDESKLGVANIDLTKVSVEPGTVFFVYGPSDICFYERLKKWAGPDVEIVDATKFSIKSKVAGKSG